jgi:hypothetical protein
MLIEHTDDLAIEISKRVHWSGTRALQVSLGLMILALWEVTSTLLMVFKLVPCGRNK